MFPAKVIIIIWQRKVFYFLNEIKPFKTGLCPSCLTKQAFSGRKNGIFATPNGHFCHARRPFLEVGFNRFSNQLINNTLSRPWHFAFRDASLPCLPDVFASTKVRKYFTTELRLAPPGEWVDAKGVHIFDFISCHIKKLYYFCNALGFTL